jgi:CBS domain-containing protein
MKAEQLMTRRVCTCLQTDSLEQAARIMWDSDVGCLVVNDGQHRPIGMITDRDIAMAALTQGVALRNASVASAMSKQVLTCSPSTSVSDVEALMRSAQIRRVPVVGSEGKLVGIVALGDLARSTQSGPRHVTEIPGLAKTLAGITQRRWDGGAVAQ